MADSSRTRTLLAGLGTLLLAWHLAGVHRWFAEPFATWTGWDEAYIAAFAQRLIDGHWLPYVDAVSHRGPVLYWIAALVQWIAGGHSWAAMRHAALFFAEANLWLAFAVGAVARRPLAGFLAAATFLFATTYSMEPKDGIGFNGEIVAMPFVLIGAALTTIALQRRAPGSDSRIWLITASGALVMVGALTKQPALLHLAPLSIWALAVAVHERGVLGRVDLRPLLGLWVGAATPALAVVAYFAQAGAWRPFTYYLFTYNRIVYMGPVSAGYALESSYLFWRDNVALLIFSMIGVAWAAAHFWSKLDGGGARGWASALVFTGVPSTTAAHLILAMLGAISTFRFWEHYFITVLPWFGLLGGLLVEDRLPPAGSAGALRPRRTYVTTIVMFVAVSFVFRHLSTLWLGGVRKEGEMFLAPDQDPIASYIRHFTPPNQSVFVWGFAPEIYVSAKRRAASRFVFTTFPSGMVPWFTWLSREQEDELAVPGSRRVLVQELEAEAPPLIVDVPNSLHGRSIRRYPMLARFVDEHYCFRTTLVGHNGRVADIFHRRHDDQPCPLPPPPLPDTE